MNRHTNCITSLRGITARHWKKYFEKLINEENDREPKKEEVAVVNKEVNRVSREKVKNALRKIKKR